MIQKKTEGERLTERLITDFVSLWQGVDLLIWDGSGVFSSRGDDNMHRVCDSM